VSSVTSEEQNWNVCGYGLCESNQVKSSQVIFIYIALFTEQIVSKQLHSDNMKVVQHRSIILLNIKY